MNTTFNTEFEVIRTRNNDLKASSRFTHNGATFTVDTYKNLNGVAVCTARQVQQQGRMILISCSDSWSKTLAYDNESSRITEKVIRTVHAAGLREFVRMAEANELPKDETKQIEVGQIVFTHGNGSIRERVIYRIDESEYGINYRTAYLDGSGLTTDNYIRPYSKKFGIGVYFNEGEKYEGDINELVARCQAAEQERAEVQRREEEERIRIREEKIEAGKHIVKVPSWAKSVILGTLYSTEFRMDDSYNTTAVESVVLGFSANDIAYAAELKKAALNCDKTKDLADAEKRSDEKFIGSKWNGWSIFKVPLNYDELCIVAADGGYFAPDTQEAPVASAEENSGCRIVHNEGRDGIELYFSGKPSETVLNHLKSNGFRWAKYNKCWYKVNSEAARKVAAQYGTVPASAEQSSGDAFDNAIIDQTARNIGA
jgi:hypothetical protein